MKDFEWQYSDEKLLLKANENIISFLLSKYYLFILSFVVSFILILAWQYNELYFSSIIIVFLLFWLLFYYLRYMFINTYFIITSRRVLKLVKNGLLTWHKKEIKLLDIQWTTSRKNFFESILGYWNILVQAVDKDANIYFKWLSNHSDINNYIWRVIDYIKLNWHTDNISRYRTKKERKN